MRTEKDFIGELEIEDNLLYGIHSLRAKQNFPTNDLFSFEWYKAVGLVKYACFKTYKKFKIAALKKYKDKKFSNEFIANYIVDT